jgi:prepilin-type N-terminal cleavage/methylation domain-containing protein
MMPPPPQDNFARSEHGVTLIELLVAMLIALVVSLAAFSILQFTSEDVSRITNRTQANQTGRVALEKIMLALHSACVAVTVNPIQPKSTGTAIKFVSAMSGLNSEKEPVATLPLSTVRLHEIIYNGANHTLVEKTWAAKGTKKGEYTFNNLTETATETKLLSGVNQTGATPIFRYYRYYLSTDPSPALGHLDETEPISDEHMALEKTEKEETTTEAEKVAKVTVGFTLSPEGHESIIAKGGQPVVLEDSAVLRFTPAAETSGNEPCAQI